MKISKVLLSVAVLMIGQATYAESMDHHMDMKMDMPDHGKMNMSEMMPDAHHQQMQQMGMSQMVSSKGVIRAIDAKAGTLKISHNAMPELKTPAMTMDFKVAKPELLQGLKVGQKIEFQLQCEGMKHTITDIKIIK